MHDLTAARPVDTLGGLVELVDRFTLTATDTLDDWTIREDPQLEHRAELRWDHLALTVRALGDLDLARFVVLERQRARTALRTHVLDVVDRAGIRGRRPFLRPATIRVNAGLTRCPGCGANVAAGHHRPGSEDCDETRRERDHQLAT